MWKWAASLAATLIVAVIGAHVTLTLDRLASLEKRMRAREVEATRVATILDPVYLATFEERVSALEVEAAKVATALDAHGKRHHGTPGVRLPWSGR